MKRRITNLHVAFVATTYFALAASALPAAAQITTGTVSGTVKDAQGGVIPGASVTLISETQGTRATPVVTSSTGDFVFPNVVADTYTVQVEMPAFKTLKRSGVSVSPGSRVAIGDLTIEIGGATETIDVKGEAPPIQSTTGERSFTVEPDEVSNLPIADRNFASLAELAPGVTGTERIGGGGATNFMMDGVSTMDTGSNRLLLAVNVESIAQVKVMTSNYQAEYGRSSGLQITAVTRTGTNRYRGGLYDVERNSDWNTNSKVNKLNGDPKDITKRREWGFSIGGPIGKPGGRNKLFFFYAQEFQPRTAGNDVVRYRVPTVLERQGDFSQSTDNNGNPYVAIRDPRLAPVTCSNTNTAGCFADGGVVGRIPANMLYQTGLNILKMWPLPNLTAQPGQRYNFQLTRPEESILGYQPAIRVDYQPWQSLRANYKYTAWAQRNQTINGTLPGFNDTRMQHPLVSTMTVNVNYTATPTTFLEATYGRSQNEQAGCALSGAPTFCQSALAMDPIANRINAGLGDLPFLFPNANVLNPNYYAYRVLNDVGPPIWDGRQILLPPAFSWGSRVADAPPNIGFPGFLNTNVGQDFSVSVTKVKGRHTVKAGFYNTHSYKAQQRTSSFGALNFQQDSVGTNPCDTSFGFANAATGCFSSFQQASSYVEGVFIYNNTEGYVQDNWKVSRKLTLDYGVRLVHQQPQYDSLLQASNFLPEKWVASEAPMLYVAGCVNNANPCSGTNRQARDPRTGQLLGPTSSVNIGTLVPGSGNFTNGIRVSGQGIAKTTYEWPALALAPRFGMAYDISGRQRFVLRGGFGLFFDRPDGNSIFDQVSNPPASRNITVRYGNLQQLGAAGLTTEGAPALNVFKYDSKLPSSLQWNWGIQTVVPYGMTLDVSWVGNHSYNLIRTINLNSIDLGTAFLPQNQDLTLNPSATPGATALQSELMRPYRGYGNIDQRWDRGVTTFHSLQFSLQRRLRNGFSFGVNDTVGLLSKGNTNPRLQHNADGSYFIRDDQKLADELLGNTLGSSNALARNTTKINFVWDLPDLKSPRPALRALGLAVNDWQLSGVWTGRTGQTYTIGFSYQSGGSAQNLTGSPNFTPRVRVVGDPWDGCSRDIYRQFNPRAFQGPLNNSVGLESGNNYLSGCKFSQLDLAIARNLRFKRGRNIQLRVDMFNAPNQARITGRNATMNLSNPGDPVTITNLPYDANGNLVVSRSLPRGAGFGVANGYQSPRTVQGQIRFSF